MFLKSLTLNNFGQYFGEQILDLTVDPFSDRNVVLIGGLNGAGKTTLLEALRICLYGNKTTQWGERYYAKIKDLLNWRAEKMGEHTMSLSVEFIIPGISGDSSIRIEREWNLQSSPTQFEECRVIQDGLVKSVNSAEQYEEFIREFIPEPISHFFFFDGEKIQTMANDEGHDKKLVSAIEDILNINTYKTLIGDLESYIRKFARDGADAPKRSEIKRYEAEIETNEERQNALEEEITEGERTIGRLNDDIAEIKKNMNRQYGSGIGSTPSRYGQVLADIDSAERSRDAAKKRLRELAGNELPFVIVTNLLEELGTRIKEEATIEKVQLTQTEFDARLSKFELVLGEYLAKFGFKSHTEIVEAVRMAWKDVFGAETVPTDAELWHNLSVDDRQDILDTIAKVTGIREELASTVAEMEKTTRRLHQLRMQRGNTPNDQGFESMMTKLEELTKDVGQLEEKIRQRRYEKDMLAQEHQRLQRQLTTTIAKVQEQQEEREKIRLAREYMEALGKFVRRLTTHKAKEVESYLTDMYQRLAQKGDTQVSRFKISDMDFSVTIFSPDGNAVPKERLAAGEKQVYAISLLWALAKASHRDLPIIIDTPLARLDSIHRRKIVTEYLPNASKQVIVLSTDTEIDRQLFIDLRPYVAREYCIHHVKGENRSHIESTYFFRGGVA